MKKSYTPPTLDVLGAIADLTAGQSRGAVTDDAFPAGTPFGDLTFSG